MSNLNCGQRQPGFYCCRQRGRRRGGGSIFFDGLWCWDRRRRFLTSCGESTSARALLDASRSSGRELPLLVHGDRRGFRVLGADGELHGFSHGALRVKLPALALLDACKKTKGVDERCAVARGRPGDGGLGLSARSDWPAQSPSATAPPGGGSAPLVHFVQRCQPLKVPATTIRH